MINKSAGNSGYHYQLDIKKGRKTVALSVSPGNTITVQAPPGISEKFIDKLLNDKRGWIEKRFAENQRLFPDYEDKSFSNGEVFSYLGSDLTLVYDDKARKPVYHPGTIAVSPRGRKTAAENIKGRLISWFKENTREIIKNRIEKYSPLTGLTPQGFTIKTLRSRWGSCSSMGNLNFNWKIIMAPIHIIDYVVVHELCHLLHNDHSKNFWQEVERIIPDYRERRKWLKTYGAKYNI